MKKDVKMNALKSEAKATSKNFQVLTDEALDQVFGGVGGSYYPTPPPPALLRPLPGSLRYPSKGKILSISMPRSKMATPESRNLLPPTWTENSSAYLTEEINNIYRVFTREG